jgi:hypothetical protein
MYRATYSDRALQLQRLWQKSYARRQVDYYDQVHAHNRPESYYHAFKSAVWNYRHTLVHKLFHSLKGVSYRTIRME